jgi:branched-subunit amino acid transport protein
MENYKMKFVPAVTILSIWLSGCMGATGNIGAENPIERGLSYIACAIVTGAVIQAIFNK